MATQPPNKRRKLSTHDTQNIHIHDQITTSITHQIPSLSAHNDSNHNTQASAFPLRQGTAPNTVTESKTAIHKFQQYWENLVDHYVPKICTQPCNIDSAPRSESILSSNDNNAELQSLQQQITRLKQENTALREELQKTKKRSRKYMNLYDAAIKEKDRYKLRLKALAQMMKTGQRPQFDRVAMNKMDPISTQQIHNIKRDIKSHYISKPKPKKMKNNDICVEITKYKNHKWISKKSLTQIIKQHIIANANHSVSKPDLLMNNARMQYNFVIQTFRIKKGSHRIKALSTGYQRGLKVLLDVPKATVIGQYIGIESTMEEFQSIFCHSNEEAVRNTYAFDLTLQIPIVDDNGTFIEYKEGEMVIDGYGLREKIYQYQQNERNGSGECPYSAHLLYINDCRSDICMDHPGDDDMKYWNVDFVEAVVNGYPAVFLITRCDIEKGTELMSYYGENYDVALNQQTEYQRMQNCIVTLLDNSVLRGIDLSGDVWTLE